MQVFRVHTERAVALLVAVAWNTHLHFLWGYIYTCSVKMDNFELAILADSIFSSYLCHRDWLLL